MEITEIKKRVMVVDIAGTGMEYCCVEFKANGVAMYQRMWVSEDLLEGEMGPFLEEIARRRLGDAHLPGVRAPAQFQGAVMKFISLFAGIGGFDLGFERAGMECVAQVEWDDKARLVLKRHWPDVDRSVSDVREFRPERGTADLICGGFPCQDVSVAGKRAGLDGERSGLWFEFARVIGECRPRWVVIENVPGLLSSNGGRDMGAVIRALVEFGYGVAWRVLDAQYFGLAQRRKRVFIVGSLGNGSAAEVLFEREGVSWDTPARGGEGEGVAGTLRERASSSHREDSETYIAAPTLTASNDPSRSPQSEEVTRQVEAVHRAMIAAPRVARQAKGAFTDPVNDNVIPIAFQQNTRDEVRKIGGDGQIAGALAAQPGMKQQNYIAWHNHTDGVRPINDDKAPTMTKHWGTGGHNVPFVGVRRLTPTECERLQGFPDGWTAGQSDSARYRQLGNAVAVPVAEWIGRRIMEVDNG